MSLNEINVKQLKTMFDKDVNFILLDVRTENEVIISKISKSIHIPMNDISNRFTELDKSTEIIVYCKSGKRSSKVCEFLISNQFNNIKNLSGGIIAWSKEIDPSIIVY